MTRYLVLEPRNARERSEGAVFVRDRFCLAAFLVPPLWLARHRLFLAALLALAGSLALGWLGREAGLGRLSVLPPLLLHLGLALEAPSLRAGWLRRRGFRDTATVEAGGRAEAEILYYADPAVAPPLSEPPAEGRAPSLLLPAALPRSGRPRRTLLDAPGR